MYCQRRRADLCLVTSVALLVAWAGVTSCETQPSGPEAGTISLPQPDLTGPVSVEEAMAKRRSVRSYDKRPLKQKEIAHLLWAAQGVTASWGGRTAPSAGALYPLEVYIAVNGVEGLPAGVYSYEPKGHRLRQIRSGDVRDALSQAALGQRCVRDAPAIIVISAVYERTTRKYGPRGRRYVYMEVGYASQNVYLQCEALGLGTVAVGAFDDDKVKRILGEDPEPLLLMPVGPKPGQ